MCGSTRSGRLWPGLMHSAQPGGRGPGHPPPRLVSGQWSNRQTGRRCTYMHSRRPGLCLHYAACTCTNPPHWPASGGLPRTSANHRRPPTLPSTTAGPGAPTARWQGGCWAVTCRRTSRARPSNRCSTVRIGPGRAQIPALATRLQPPRTSRSNDPGRLQPTQTTARSPEHTCHACTIWLAGRPVNSNV